MDARRTDAHLGTGHAMLAEQDSALVLVLALGI